MDDEPRSPQNGTQPERLPRPRRVRATSRLGRVPLAGTAAVLAAAILVLLVYRFVAGRSSVTADVIDFSQSIQQIQDLSTVKSQIRFGVVVREENGNVIVRRLLDQAESIGMENLSSALFQDPTMIVELHGIATYGVRLGDLKTGMRQNDTAVFIHLPNPTVLDVKLAAQDTRVVARMKGLFRSPNEELLLEANRYGERFVQDYAARDTAILALASSRARELLGLLVERSGKRAIFE